MANHVVLKVGKVASKNVDAFLKSARHATVDIDNGNLIALGGLVAGEKDLFTAATPVDVTAEEVFLVDEPVRTLVNGAYAINVADPREFYVPAGKAFRVRKLVVGDTIYVTAAGFESTPSVGKYAIPANGKKTLTPANDLSGNTKVAFKVIATENFYIGTETVTGYRLECVVAV